MFLSKTKITFRLFQANSGKDTNGCQFFITCTNCEFLDGKHVVFGMLYRSIYDFNYLHLLFAIVGRVIEGMLVVRKIENVPVAFNNKPKIPVIISQCGEM